MAAAWVRILAAAGDITTPLDKAVDRLSSIGEARAQTGSLSRRARKAEAAAPVVTVLARQLVAGVLVSDLMIDRLCALAGQNREQVLDQVSGELPTRLQDAQLRAALAELSESYAPLRDVPSYAGLASRVEQLLRLAEEEASAIVAAARAQAAEITAPAGQDSIPGADRR